MQVLLLRFHCVAVLLYTAVSHMLLLPLHSRLNAAYVYFVLYNFLVDRTKFNVIHPAKSTEI